MERINDKAKEENMREYLKSYVDFYSKLREQIGIPLNKEELEGLMDEIDIGLFEDENTTGTFQVSQNNKFFYVVMNNFMKNGNKRNEFLLKHEMTHLSSAFNKEYNERLKELPKFFDVYKAVQANDDVSGWDVTYGVIGVEEFLAQWCCEECNDVTNGEKRQSKIEEHIILGNSVKVKTDFSDHDIYAPLQEYVEDFAKKAGYKNLRDFSKAMLLGEKSFFDLVNEENVVALGYIGILCEGIYQENGFQKCGLPESDIPKAIKYLQNRKQQVDFPESPLDD